MKKYKISEFTKGWLVGDFSPSLIRTKDFEFAVKYYKKGDREDAHLHKKAEEITVAISGEFMMNDTVLSAGDVIKIEKNEAVSFKCLRDGATAVLKTPSIIGDKYIINK